MKCHQGTILTAKCRNSDCIFDYPKLMMQLKWSICKIVLIAMVCISQLYVTPYDTRVEKTCTKNTHLCILDYALASTPSCLCSQYILGIETSFKIVR